MKRKMSERWEGEMGTVNNIYATLKAIIFPNRADTARP